MHAKKQLVMLGNLSNGFVANTADEVRAVYGEQCHV
jgi:hypothetical protein